MSPLARRTSARPVGSGGGQGAVGHSVGTFLQRVRSGRACSARASARDRAVAAQVGLASLSRFLGSSPHYRRRRSVPPPLVGVGIGKRRLYATIFSFDRPRSLSISTERRGGSLSQAGFTPRSSARPWPLLCRPLVFTRASSVSSRQAGSWPGTGLFSRRSPGASSMPEFWQRPDAVRGGLRPRFSPDYPFPPLSRPLISRLASLIPAPSGAPAPAVGVVGSHLPDWRARNRGRRRVTTQPDPSLVEAAKSDPTLAYMINKGIPLTRERWIKLNWLGDPPQPWGVEHE